MNNYHDLESNPKDLPELGERVILCVGNAFVGEGYMKNDGKWYRYCDFEPIEKFMGQPVTGWWQMPKPTPKKPKNLRTEKINKKIAK